MHINYQLEESKRKGMIASVVIHGLLLLLCFYLLAWKQPDPPTPGSPGIELNFGLDAAGMGPDNEQPTSQSTTQPVQEEIQEEVTQPTPVEESKLLTTDQVSDVRVEDKKVKTTATEVKKEPVKEVVKTAVPKSEKVIDSRSQMGNGDKKVAGDQGDPNGSLDARALYGKNGKGNGGDGNGGNGTSLNMTGWKWLSPPKVNDNSSEAGKIVFKISVDEEGNLLSVVPVEKQVSSSVAKFYEDAVWKLEFEKTKDFTKAAQNSTGYITFIIRSK